MHRYPSAIARALIVVANHSETLTAQAAIVESNPPELIVAGCYAVSSDLSARAVVLRPGETPHVFVVPDTLISLCTSTTLKSCTPAERGGSRANMVVLCKSQVQGDLGCNQSKGAAMYVPRSRGPAFTRADLDMNCCPVSECPFEFSAAHGTAPNG
jgi:hypothetical protein